MKALGAAAMGLGLALVSTRAGTSLARHEPGQADSGCASCHADIAREWQSSAHHRAASDPLFEEAVALEPRAFCRKCHAPSADPELPTPAAAKEHGIGCTDCHSATAGHGGKATSTSRVATVACANCHEFAFPDGRPRMQGTATEHAASAFADTECSSCHMPRASKHLDHGFAVPDSMIRAGLVADVSRAGPASIAIRLAPGQVGHAFPTGDLFRRVVVNADLLDENGSVQASRRRDLKRDLASGADDRVGVDLEPCFEFDFAPIREISKPRIRVSIDYERVAHPLGPRPERAEVASRVSLLEREFAAANTAPAFRPCPIGKTTRDRPAAR